MSTSGAISVPEVVCTNATLRIVLLGWPGAGKSTLLAAIDETTEPTSGVTCSLVRYAPPASSRQADQDRFREALFVDCPGHPVAELLTQKTTPQTAKIEGGLPRLIQRADSLVVLLDASAAPADADERLAELRRFFHALERQRSRRQDIGDFPVFVVLSKADLLATATDTNNDWEERVAARVRYVQTHFQDFLLRCQARVSVPFGRLNLHFRATAAQSPPLSEYLGKGCSAYKCTDLLREALERASEFRERQTRSTLRLFGTMVGALGAIAAMIALIAFLFLQHQLEEPSIRALLAKIDSYRARTSRLASLRLREPLQPRIDELTYIRDDPLFSALPEEKRSYVVAQLEELQDYKVYKERVERVPPLVAVQTELELKEIEAALQGIVVPQQHQSSWGQTEAVLRRLERSEEVRGFGSAVDQLSKWYRALVDNSQDLWPVPKQREGSTIAWPQWHERVHRVVR